MFKKIAEVLVCRPNNFQIKYEINPWMKKGQVSSSKALSQWENLQEKLAALNIKTHCLQAPENLPDTVFCTDHLITHKRQAVLASFRFPQRRREIKIIKDWLQKNQYQISQTPKGVYLEGGDVVFWREKILLGWGYRSDKKAADFLQKVFQRKVITLKLINPYFYHLDTALFALNNKTIFYYPEAFSPTALEKLKKLAFALIPLLPQEAKRFAANSLNTDHKVITPKNVPHFTTSLQRLGYQAFPVDISQFRLSGGGIHCLTNPLRYN